jgi:hypothetical protein
MVQQVAGMFLCFKESYNAYLDECHDIISTFG